jgi:hypothetical protein
MDQRDGRKCISIWSPHRPHTASIRPLPGCVVIAEHVGDARPQGGQHMTFGLDVRMPTARLVCLTLLLMATAQREQRNAHWR